MLSVGQRFTFCEGPGEDGTTFRSCSYVATLGPGQVFGEMAFFGDGRRNSDIVAETPARVFSMFGTRFREMQMSMPEVTAGLEDLVEQRRSALAGG